ncbi:hypothetical protein N4G41_08370 [Kosakonia sacchari]|uniref:hypothetical protein n=1 Tax=Kosakonia sacchari TaxID=1158459 RepID=UPI002ACECF68|nr:hypothetical protein [Kosakonia sacchari]MDZ7321652.1 hypothetical protein [Kosakonia sacchari]
MNEARESAQSTAKDTPVWESPSSKVVRIFRLWWRWVRLSELTDSFVKIMDCWARGALPITLVGWPGSL